MSLRRIVTLAAFALLYLPLLAMVAGTPLEGYRRVFADPELGDALATSLWVGGWSALISVALGTSLALALERARFRGRRALELLTTVPLVMPEIVTGLSLLIWFVLLRISLGRVSLVLAHVTFCLSYVVVTVRARIHGLDPALEEAAYDLGASRWMAFRRVTFPLIRPGVLAGGLMAFTLSFDDFLVSFFVSGPGSETLPLRIYSKIRFGLSPELHAVCSLIFLATIATVAFAARAGKPERR